MEVGTKVEGGDIASSMSIFETIVKNRRAIRRFLPDAVEKEKLDWILDCSRWAPSGYNLQPTHFIVVDDPAIKQKLLAACLGQRQILEAPLTVVFVGDKRAVENNLETILKSDLEAQAIDPAYEPFLRKYVGQAFNQGPWGFGWLGKFIVAPFLRLFRPLPSIPAIQKRYWTGKQVMLSAMNFMLAAQAAGLSTVPMEGFDESRVRKILGIPRSCIIPIIIPIGYQEGAVATKSRRPLDCMVHQNRWESILK